MNPVDRLIKIEGIPSQLIGDLVNPLAWLVLGVRVERGMLSRFKGTVC